MFQEQSVEIAGIQGGFKLKPGYTINTDTLEAQIKSNLSAFGHNYLRYRWETPCLDTIMTDLLSSSGLVAIFQDDQLIGVTDLHPVMHPDQHIEFREEAVRQGAQFEVGLVTWPNIYNKLIDANMMHSVVPDTVAGACKVLAAGEKLFSMTHRQNDGMKRVLNALPERGIQVSPIQPMDDALYVANYALLHVPN